MAGEDLHQALRAGGGGARVELGLGVDHRRDQRGVEVLFGGLLADHARVLQRQRQFAHRVLQARGERHDQPDRHREHHERAQQPPP